MRNDLTQLNEYLSSINSDGYLIEGDSNVPDQRYLSGFNAPDPFITLYTDREIHVLIAGMEQHRAKSEGTVTTVERNETYGINGRIQIYGKDRNINCLIDFLHDHGVSSVAVPYWFSAATADGLREAGINVQTDTDGVILDIRAKKSPKEIDNIQQVQNACEKAMKTAEQILNKASVKNEKLYYDGATLTSDRVRKAIETELLKKGCSHPNQEPIVACGELSADPHNSGNGPLHIDKPIIVDIFPRSKSTHYFGDITRTFLKGTPCEEIKSMYETVYRAQKAALDSIEPGIKAESIHNTACDIIEEAGYESTRTTPKSDHGFIHRTGHGVGLELHENPRIGPKGGNICSGQVVTIEPGIYKPEIGGVRIEDLVSITEDGYKNLTDYPKYLEV